VAQRRPPARSIRILSNGKPAGTGARSGQTVPFGYNSQFFVVDPAFVQSVGLPTPLSKARIGRGTRALASIDGQVGIPLLTMRDIKSGHGRSEEF
jgi:hypothetical protein